MNNEKQKNMIPSDEGLFLSKYYKAIKDGLKKEDWTRISQLDNLSHEFIHDNEDKIDWSILGKHNKLEVETVDKYWDKMSNDALLCRQKLSYKTLKKLLTRGLCERQKATCACTQTLTSDLLDFFIGVDTSLVGDMGTYVSISQWENISFYQDLTESDMVEYTEYISWENASAVQDMSDSFIKEMLNPYLLEVRRNFYPVKKEDRTNSTFINILGFSLQQLKRHSHNSQ